MLSDNLLCKWEAHWHECPRRERSPIVTEAGLMLGATVLAKFEKHALQIDERRVLALLSVAYDKPVPPQAIGYIRAAEKAYKRKDKAHMSMLLALAGLGMLEKVEQVKRLFIADEALSEGVPLGKMLKAFGFNVLRKGDDGDSDDSEDGDNSGNDGHDFDDKHPRWPAGSPGDIGGQFRPKDDAAAAGTAGDALAGNNSPSVDDIRNALVNDFNNPSALSAGTQVAANDGIQSDITSDIGQNNATSQTTSSNSSQLNLEQGITVKTPYAMEVQENSPEALQALQDAIDVNTLYRTIQLGESMAGESQYWSLYNPLTTPNYANLMGVPSSVMPDAVLQGTLNPSASVVTNRAQGIGQNIGGGIQVVTSSDAVKVSSMTAIDTSSARGGGGGGGGVALSFPGSRDILSPRNRLQEPEE